MQINKQQLYRTLLTELNLIDAGQHMVGAAAGLIFSEDVVQLTSLASDLLFSEDAIMYRDWLYAEGYQVLSMDEDHVGIKTAKGIVVVEKKEEVAPAPDDTDKLIGILQGINDGTIEVGISSLDASCIADDTYPEGLLDLVEKVLMVGGGCNWPNIERVRDAGFRVYPGEKDSFGWLSGCIDTEKGTICYG